MLVSDDPGSAAQQNPTVAYGITEIAAAWRDDRAGNADARARRAAMTGTDHFGLGYDGLERLTAVTVTNPESFVLDAASNISRRTGPTATYTYATANRMTSDGIQSYLWSQTDHLNSRGTDTFAYDALNTSSTVGGTARTFTYNGDGLLQSRTQAGSTSSLLWSLARSPARTDDRRCRSHHLRTRSSLRSERDGSTVTSARDGLGSVRAELGPTGALTAAFRFLARSRRPSGLLSRAARARRA